MKRVPHGVKFLPDQRGAALVELALLAVPLFVLIIGTFQNVLVSIARISLDSTLQSMTYDAANQSGIIALRYFTRSNLCGRSGFYLVDCAKSPDVCFAVIPLDFIALADIATLPCQGSAGGNSMNTGPVAIIVEYRIPNYFNISGFLTSGKTSLPTQSIIRSVALYVQV